MGKILTGFEFTAAKSKREVDDEAPTRESMRGSRTLMANPSTDQKKVRRELNRKTASQRLADLMEQARDFGKSKGLTDEEASRFAKDIGDVWAEDGLDTPPDVMDALVRSYHHGYLAGGDLWDNAEDCSMGPVVSRNPGTKGSSKTAADIDQLRSIRDDFKTEKMDGMLVDPTTANAILTVHDALSPENQEKFKSMPVDRMADVAWKLVKPASLESYVDFREAAAALDEPFEGPRHVSWGNHATAASTDGMSPAELREHFSSDNSDEDEDKPDYSHYEMSDPETADWVDKQKAKEAFMTDFAHVRQDAEALNGYGVALTYNGDQGMHTTVGELSYDGNTCSVRNAFGRVITVPISQVLGIEETTSDSYNQRPFDAGPEGKFNPITPLFNGLVPSAMSSLKQALEEDGTWPLGGDVDPSEGEWPLSDGPDTNTDWPLTEHEGHIDPKKPVPDYPHALEDMRQHLLNHTDLDGNPIPEKKASMDILMGIIAENEAY
jgi:hypothetical protein